MPYCPHCDAQVQEGSKFCSTCGEQIILEATPAVEQEPVITGAYDARLVKTKKKRKISNLLIIAIVGAVAACLCLFALAIVSRTPTDKATATARAVAKVTEAARPTDTPGPTLTPGPTDTPLPTDTPIPPTATPTPIPAAPPFKEMEATVEKMTEAQWKAYLRGLKGLRVESWSGWVEDVNEKFLGGYELLVDLDSPEDPWSSTDVIFDIPDDIALKLVKDQPVTFSGRIKSVGEFMGSLTVSLEDATLDTNE